MQGSAWIALLRRIPADLHDSIVLGLVTGAEVMVQQLIRMENDFAIIRGRMAGSTAEARIMMVPYTHLAFVAFSKQMSEPEVQDLFGKSAPGFVPVAASASLGSIRPSQEPRNVSLATDGTGAGPARNRTPEAPAVPASPPSKSILLARLRERLAEKAK